MLKYVLLISAVLGALGVGLGAFGAHALQSAAENWPLEEADRLRRLSSWEVAVRYQMYHALALFGCGLIAQRRATRVLAVAAWCFLAGTMIFSGFLYAYVLSGVRVLGAIVPIGGTALIAGWLLLAAACLPGRSDSSSEVNS